MSGPKAQPIIAIDLLRFACAMLVVAYHYGAVFAASPDTRVAVVLAHIPSGMAAHPLAQAGSVGVELFFVISGLVIAQSRIGTGWTTFLRHRVLRLAPAAWICATITLLALTLDKQGNGILLADWWRSMRFWPIGPQIDGSYWTLGVEVSFYLLVTVAGRGRGEPRHIARLGYAIGGISAVFWGACLVTGSYQTVMTNQTAILLLLPHGCLFALGMMIGTRPAKGWSAARYGAFAALFAVALIEVSAHIGGWRATPATVLALIIFATGIALLLASPWLQEGLSRWITPKTARAIGLVTYPLYLLHQVAGAVLLGALLRTGVPNPLAMTMTISAALILAWLIARHAEPRLRRMLGLLLDRLGDLADRSALKLRRAPARDIPPSASLPTG